MQRHRATDSSIKDEALISICPIKIRRDTLLDNKLNFMTRVKKGVNALKGRRNVLRQTKGFRHGRSTKERAASEALLHAGAYAFAHRRDKKGDFRKLWTVRINAALGREGISYSKFIGSLKRANIGLDRKILSILADQNPNTFQKVVERVK